MRRWSGSNSVTAAVNRGLHVADAGALVSSVTIFVLSLWLGWGLTLAGAEWWITKTRTVSG